MPRTLTKITEELRALLEGRPKWQHDGIDRYESWWLGDEENPTATVNPEWGPTRRSSGTSKPSYWTASIGTKDLGRFPNIGDAKKAVEAALSSAE